MTNNIGPTLLIIGSLYLHLAHGLDLLLTVLLCLFAIIMWAIELDKSEKKEVKK